MLNKLVKDTRIGRLIRYCILLSLCVTLIAVFFLLLLNSYQESQMISCKTDTCKKISRELFRQLDKNVSACNDFTQYVCGKKQSLFKDNEETHYTSTMKQILDYFHENHNNVAEVPLFVDAIEFYKSCINQESRNSARYEDLFDIYKEIGGFPLLQLKQFIKIGFRYERPLINLYRKIKKNFIFDVEITTDQSGGKVVYIKKYSKIFKNDPKWIAKYKLHIKEIVRLIHSSPDELDEFELDRDVDELVLFEQKLNNVSFNNSLSITLNLFNITNYTPNMDWSYVLKASVVDNIKNFYPEYNDVISIGRDTTRHINKLLTNEKTFINYLAWQITQHYASFTTISLMKLREKFLQDIEDDNLEIEINEDKEIIKDDILQNKTTLKTPLNDEFDQVSSNLKEICSKQTIIEFQIPIDYVFKNNFLNQRFDKFKHLLRDLINLMVRKLENSLISDDVLTMKLSERLNSISVNEILQRSPKSFFCFENFASTSPKSFVSSIIHIESFNHLNDLCIQANQKNENKKRFNNDKTKIFELETRTYIPLTSMADSIPNFFLISRFGSLLSSYLFKNVILSEDNTSMMSYELRNLFNAKLNCFKEQVIGKNYEDAEMSSSDSIEQFIIQSESLNLSQELFFKLLNYNNNDQLLENQITHNLNQLFFISYVNGYCHYFNSKTQHNQLFKNLVNFSIKNSPVFLDTFNCLVDHQIIADKCTLF